MVVPTQVDPGPSSQKISPKGEDAEMVSHCSSAAMYGPPAKCSISCVPFHHRTSSLRARRSCR
jgi:hypothetical protein